jgi:hypothetical protein
MDIEITTSDADAVDPLHVYHLLTKAGYLVHEVSINFGERRFANDDLEEAV